MVTESFNEEETPTREEMISLREKGMTREQMAEYYDVGVTTIRRWIKVLEVPRPSKQARQKRETYLSRNGEIIAPVEDDRTNMEKAEDILGERLTEKRGRGYFLDGRPASVFKIMEAAGIDFS